MRTYLITLIGLFSALTSFGQVKKCCETYVYEGYILTKQNKKLTINLNFLVLLDSTIVGSYHYIPKNGSLKLVGHLNKDNSFELVERDNNETVTGFFKGNLTSGKSNITGIWSSPKKDKNFKFKLDKTIGKSYWDYIHKNRSLYEYKDIRLAILENKKVLSIDVAGQDINKLPGEIFKLKNIVSFNLLGNKFKKFPKELSSLKTLNEISMSSNELAFVGPEIGRLENLRILILNFNRIKSLPKEIGQLTNLLYLELGRNQLTTLPDEIRNLTSLQELHIENNNISEREKKRIQNLLPNCVIHF
ncbi:leucine-rich repeat domain-containing protein [Pedobacter frigiditerrae]|uniref:Leucine-rich repeat domain-containing protein n=1 Tax=Pedobacter frigiditerrae TaxID=2530452 RepID=A0A4R0MP29_9SPHI|nr:leucine-rich repeat domain-containing protein [Pedobacter frigiditerrae]TCC88247.1 leucine-rich repeat domain-containing protein [Pedobacter frigiditerrae]